MLYDAVHGVYSISLNDVERQKSSILNASNKSSDDFIVAQTDGRLHDPFNLPASHANPTICSLAFLSPVDAAPRRPATQSNRSKLISFRLGNLIKHKSHFPSFLSLLPASHISWRDGNDSEERRWQLSVCDEWKAPWGILWSMTERPGSFWMYACVTAY